MREAPHQDPMPLLPVRGYLLPQSRLIVSSFQRQLNSSLNDLATRGVRAEGAMWSGVAVCLAD